MPGFVYTLPLFLPLLLLLAGEINGFRDANDHWPTISQLIKGWEDHKPAIVSLTANAHLARPLPATVHVVTLRGLPAWTWERWTVALGIPVVGLILELHLVRELF